MRKTETKKLQMLLIFNGLSIIIPYWARIEFAKIFGILISLSAQESYEFFLLVEHQKILNHYQMLFDETYFMEICVSNTGIPKASWLLFVSGGHR